MLEKLSLKDSLWRSMALNITKDKDYANELVQEMYLRVLDYNVSEDKATDVFINVVMINIYKESNKKPINRDTYCYSFSGDTSNMCPLVLSLFNQSCDSDSDYSDRDIGIINKIKSLPLEDRTLLELNYNNSIRKVADIQGVNYMYVYRELMRIREYVLGDSIGKEYKNRRLKYKNDGRNVA